MIGFVKAVVFLAVVAGLTSLATYLLNQADDFAVIGGTMTFVVIVLFVIWVLEGTWKKLKGE